MPQSTLPSARLAALAPVPTGGLAFLFLAAVNWRANRSFEGRQLRFAIRPRRQCVPCIIRKDIGERYENVVELADDEWRLQPQVEALEYWLRQNPHGLDPTCRWVADIGFCVRSDARGGGPVISRELMRMCIAANV